MQHVVLVHPDGSGPQSIADSDGGVEALCVDCGGETVGSGVAETDGVVFGLEFGNGADGAEDLLLHYLHVFGHARENGRLDKVALFAMALATNFDLGALFLAGINITAFMLVYLLLASRVKHGLPHDTVVLQLRDLRTLECVRSEWVADFVLLRPSLESFNKFVVNTLLNIDPGSSTTTLAVVEEDTKIDPRNRVLDICIIKDNIRALATKLQCNLLQIRTSSRFHNLSADNGRSSECNLVNVHVGREGSTCHFAEAGNNIDNTGGETSFFDQLGGVESAEGSLFRGLENDDVAAGYGRADLPSPHEEGEVPGDNLSADTNLDTFRSA